MQGQSSEVMRGILQVLVYLAQANLRCQPRVCGLGIEAHRCESLGMRGDDVLCEALLVGWCHGAVCSDLLDRMTAKCTHGCVPNLARFGQALLELCLQSFLTLLGSPSSQQCLCIAHEGSGLEQLGAEQSVRSPHKGP